MAIVLRLVRLAIVFVIGLAVVGVLLLGFVTTRAFPQTTGTVKVPGLDGSASVIRDSAGIARIYADSPHDLFLAQGYVHAQDRFWQMEVWRHISAGRLSELFGKATLDTDKFVRTLDWRGAAKRDYETFSPELKDALDAYAHGVNVWLDQHRGNLGLAFVVTGLTAGIGGIDGYEPEPWTAVDSAAWQKVQAWNLGGNYATELFRALADDRLGGPKRTDSLFPAYRSDAPVITPSGLQGSGGAGAGAGTSTGANGDAGAITGADEATAATLFGASPDRSSALEPSTPEGGRNDLAAWRHLASIGASISTLAGLDASSSLAGQRGIGSNDWVVGPDKSASGGALLANDPHLGLSMPSVWYMNGLHCRNVSAACPYDVVGVSFPGVPSIVLGHNARIAWGATNVGPDVQDLVVETPDPDDPDSYEYKGKSERFKRRIEEIKVAGGDTVKLTVRTSRHGPILNDVLEDLEGAPPTALRWTALAEPDRTVDAAFHLATASNFHDFREALRMWTAPSQNLVYADVDGHVGYQLAGSIPIRSEGDDGARPVPGDGKHEWVGRIAFDDLPWQLDPKGGVIVTANNAPVDEHYPYLIGNEWDTGDRAQRILDLLKEAEPQGISTDEMRTIQMDTYLPRADRLLAALPDVEPATSDGRSLLARMKGWDRRCDVDSQGCAAYIAFELRLTGAIFDDELGPLARDYVDTDWSWAKILDLVAHPDDPWWDDAQTEEVAESAPQVITQAIDRTASDLRSTLGEPGNWTWGRLHTLTLRETIYGSSGIGPLEWYFNAGTRPAPGAAGAIDNLYYEAKRSYPDRHDPDYIPVGLAEVFDVTSGPSYRLTIDMSDLESARIVQTTGQSGNPFDPHYGDLIDRWLKGETVPLPWSPSTVQNAAAATLTLEP